MVIDVDNSDLRLMPGMTAFVTIIISEKENVWRAANSAFLLRSFANFLDAETINGATPVSHLAILRDGNVVMVPYTKGLSTATETEIISDEIQMGDKVIVGRVGMTSTSNKQQTMNPMRGPRMR